MANTSNRGTLYLIPTALAESAANATLPAPHWATMQRLQHFVVETAKTARAELKRMAHPTPLAQLNIREMPRTWSASSAKELLQPAIDGHDVGVLSDAGCPGVADPGALLVREAHHLGIRVEPLIGPSSLLLSLMASGLNGQRFAFHGYLPVKDDALAKELQRLEKESARQDMTQIFIETPYRNLRMLGMLVEHCQTNTLLCLASGLTGAQQQINTMPISDWRKQFKTQHGELEAKLERTPCVFLMLASK